MEKSIIRLLLFIFLIPILWGDPVANATGLWCPIINKIQKESEQLDRAALGATVAINAGAVLAISSLLKNEDGASNLHQRANATQVELSLLSREELMKLAKSALIDWREKGDSGINLGEFFVHYELLEEQDPEFALLLLEDFLHKRSFDTETIHGLQSQAPGSMESIDKIREFEINQYMGPYSRPQSMMTGFYKGEDGNCEAETKKFIADFYSAKVVIPEGKILGVQFLPKHVQPVLYDPKSNEVINLVDRKKVDHVQGPIFHPMALVHGVLSGEGEDTEGVALNDLLIAKPDDGPDSTIIDYLSSLFGPAKSTDLGFWSGGPGSETNTTLSFSFPLAWYAKDAPNPDHIPASAKIGHSPISDSSSNLGSIDGSEEDLLSNQGAVARLASAEELSKEAPFRFGADFAFICYSEKEADHCKQEILMRNATDLASYQAAENNAHREAQIVALAHRFLSRQMKRDDYKETLLILSSPRDTKNYSIEELKRKTQMFEEMNDVIQMASEVLDLIDGNFKTKRDLLNHPVYSLIGQRLENINKKIADHPLELLTWYDQQKRVDQIKYAALENFVPKISAEFSIDNSGAYQAMSDPNKVGVRRSVQKNASVDNYIIVSLATGDIKQSEKSDTSNNNNVVIGDPLQKTTDHASEMSDKAHPQIYINPDTMIDFMIKANGDGQLTAPLISRWSPALEKIYGDRYLSDPIFDPFALALILGPTLTQELISNRPMQELFIGDGFVRLGIRSGQEGAPFDELQIILPQKTAEIAKTSLPRLYPQNNYRYTSSRVGPEDPIWNFEPKTIKDSPFGQFVPIPAGDFIMGSPLTEKNRYYDEILHPVTIKKGFEMGTTEVTQKQWYDVMSSNTPSGISANPSLNSRKKDCPDSYDQERKICPNHPVEGVDFQAIEFFIERLNTLDLSYTYRLPTEAEWEYSARGGGQSTYSFGDGIDQLSDYAWYYESNTEISGTHEVATKRANQYGLYDMEGNVGEWVSDFYGEYPDHAVIDPENKSSNRLSIEMVTRGGSWIDSAYDLRVAKRSTYSPISKSNTLGLRLLRTPIKNE